MKKIKLKSQSRSEFYPFSNIGFFGNEVFVSSLVLETLFNFKEIRIDNEYYFDGISFKFKQVAQYLLELEDSKDNPNLVVKNDFKLQCEDGDKAEKLAAKLHYKFLVFQRESVKGGAILIGKQLKNVADRIEMFFSSYDEYKKYKIPHHRGVLLYGPQGTGKSSFGRYIIDKYKEAIVSDKNEYWAIIEFFKDNFEYQDIKKIVLIDEFETFVSTPGDRLRFLKILEDCPDNTLFIATTNKPENLGAEFYDRPGRFDECIFVGNPSTSEIKSFLKFKESEELLEYCKKMSFAHINELILRVKVNKEDPVQAVKNINNPKKGVSIPNSSGPIGFGCDKSNSSDEDEDLDPRTSLIDIYCEPDENYKFDIHRPFVNKENS